MKWALGALPINWYFPEKGILDLLNSSCQRVVISYQFGNDIFIIILYLVHKYNTKIRKI